MRRRRTLFLTALTAIIALAFIGTMGINKVVSAPEEPHVYIYPAEIPTPAIGTYYPIEVRVENMPHETNEVYNPDLGRDAPLDTDKTWTWEVVITYDTSVLTIPAAPGRDSTKDWFNYFKHYTWLGFMWDTEGVPYTNGFAATFSDDEGWASATCYLMGDPSNPDEWGVIDPEGAPPGPWVDLGITHYGHQYDLPYSEGLIPTWGASYFILYKFYVKYEGPEGAYSPLHISEASFWMYDGVTKFSVTTTDGSVGLAPVPEFPLGAAVEIGLIAAVAYIWWIRRRKLKEVP